MRTSPPRRADRTRSVRTTKPDLNPYCVDEVAYTLSDILRARAADSAER